jgi:hypothetical protein
MIVASRDSCAGSFGMLTDRHLGAEMLCLLANHHLSYAVIAVTTDAASGCAATTLDHIESKTRQLRIVGHCYLC